VQQTVSSVLFNVWWRENHSVNISNV